MKIRSSIMMVAILLSAAGGALPSYAKEKDDPKKAKAKFPYNNLPVEVSCFEGQHPTAGPNGPEFPCINDKLENPEIKTNGTGATLKKGAAASAVR